MQLFTHTGIVVLLQKILELYPCGDNEETEERFNYIDIAQLARCPCIVFNFNSGMILVWCSTNSDDYLVSKLTSNQCQISFIGGTRILQIEDVDAHLEKIQYISHGDFIALKKLIDQYATELSAMVELPYVNSYTGPSTTAQRTVFFNVLENAVYSTAPQYSPQNIIKEVTKLFDPNCYTLVSREGKSLSGGVVLAEEYNKFTLVRRPK